MKTKNIRNEWTFSAHLFHNKMSLGLSGVYFGVAACQALMSVGEDFDSHWDVSEVDYSLLTCKKQP